MALYAAAWEPVSWPCQVGVLPKKADCFQDRAAVQELRRAVAGGGTAVLCQVLAGMGGVGKTQLAAHYARQVWAEGGLDLLVWVAATTREAVIAVYAQAAEKILRADPDEPEAAADAFLAWLEPKASGQRCWLVVLDDVTDPADLRGLWPPTSPIGRTLVTTRRRDAALTRRGHLVPVGLFSPAESSGYLTACLAAHGRREPDDQLADLTADLGHLPLALSQAAAYLLDADLDCAAYRYLLAGRARTLAEALPEPGTLPDDQTVTLGAAWSLSLDRADQLRPQGLARPMLHLAAMLDPNGIPHAVLTSEPALAYLTAHRRAGHGDKSGSADVTAEEAVGALRALHRLSLVDHTPNTPHQAARVHQLIQRATRDSLSTKQRDGLARTAAEALTVAWPDIERNAALAQALRANTDALIHHAEDALYQPDAHLVLFRTGNSLGDAGQVTAGVTHFQHLADHAHHRLGPDHPDTLAARNNLAYYRGEAGTRLAPPPRTPSCWTTICGCWARITPTPSSPGT